MKKLLYSARDAAGKTCQGYVEAESNEAARKKLQTAGLCEIVLHDDVFTASERAELAGLSEQELAKLAAFELGSRSRGRDTWGFLKQVFRRNQNPLWIGGALVVWGLERGDGWMIASGGLTLGALPLISLWNYRRVGRYNRLLSELAWGEWAAAQASIAALRPHMQELTQAFDLAIKEASILARTHSLAEALAFIAPWQEEIPTPGYFSARTAVLYLMVGDAAGYMAGMRTAYAQAGDSPTTRIDYALAEARFGDPQLAADLLAGMAPETIPPLGLPFVAWIRGLVARRRGEPEAVEKLAQAVDLMAASGDNPAFWVTQALCVGAYAAALLETGRLEAARQAVAQVWPVLQVHGDAALLADLAAIRPQ